MTRPTTRSSYPSQLPADVVEIWRPVVGYEVSYEVSDQGRVRSLDREVLVTTCPRRGPFLNKVRGRILKAGSAYGDNIFVSLYRDGAAWQPLVHGLVLEAFVGPRPPDHLALPRDGDPKNCALRNLRWALRADLQVAKAERGNDGAGENHPRVKLRAVDIAAIRDDTGSRTAELADRYGVGTSHIRRIRRGLCWVPKAAATHAATGP